MFANSLPADLGDGSGRIMKLQLRLGRTVSSFFRLQPLTNASRSPLNMNRIFTKKFFKYGAYVAYPSGFGVLAACGDLLLDCGSRSSR